MHKASILKIPESGFHFRLLTIFQILIEAETCVCLNDTPWATNSDNLWFPRYTIKTNEVNAILRLDLLFNLLAQVAQLDIPNFIPAKYCLCGINHS